jgi:DNA-binding transcriptional regulator YhcF (GntR family)
VGPQTEEGSGPLYLAIANAIAEDVATGQLQAEQRLPPQRKLAEALDLDFTTVARAIQKHTGAGWSIRWWDAAPSSVASGARAFPA